MEERIAQLEKELFDLKADYYKDNFISTQTFTKNVVFKGDISIEDKSINTGTTGLQIGTSSTQKIGFLGATPVSQQANISNPSGGTTVDNEARTAINSIISLLDTFGFTA